MLLWRFVGRTNVILSNGEAWTRHSHVVKSALSRNLPIHEFVLLGNKLFKKMGQGGPIKWDDFAMVNPTQIVPGKCFDQNNLQRFTLDAVGTPFGLPP